jgi:hypothetical protein
MSTGRAHIQMMCHGRMGLPYRVFVRWRCLSTLPASREDVVSRQVVELRDAAQVERTTPIQITIIADASTRMTIMADARNRRAKRTMTRDLRSWLGQIRTGVAISGSAV